MGDEGWKTKRYEAYHACRREGICTMCKREPVEPTRAACDACLQKRKEAEKRRQAMYGLPSAGASTKRECLRCDRMFNSEGAYHRLCDACRTALNDDPTPVEPLSFWELLGLDRRSQGVPEA